MPVSPAITGIIERYQASAFKGDMGRETLCREFIDPFLECLGWKKRRTGNGLGQSGLMIDVPVRISGKAGYIDYILCTREGCVLPIMVTDRPLCWESAYLLLRYAWNAGLDLAILTTFGESAVYDTTTPVQCREDVERALITTIPVDRYAEHWDRIAAVLSRECIAQGSIGLFLKKQGIKEESRIGQVLRKDLEAWRVLLAKRIALHNHGLAEDSLHDVVHYILARILFLRIMEARNLGQEGVIMRITEGGSAYGRLCGLFRYAEEEYGGGLFCFSERAGRPEPTDPLIFTLSVDDDAIKTIIAGLTSRQSPYEFAVIPARVLARVFSFYLESVIRIINGHQTVVEERPDQGKSVWPYPIPDQIAEYVVGRTLSELVKERTPQEIQTLHVLDPACGSGLFLIMAYEFLLEWHRDWYFRNLLPVLQRGDCSDDDILSLLPGQMESVNGDRILPLPISQGSYGDTSGEQERWRLTPAERKRILLSTLSGVDIDRNAVDTTKILLLVTMMEESGREGLPVPDLSSCIQCGNSIVSPDFLDDPDTSLIDPGSRERMRVFAWEDAFPHIISPGGFDGVIGSFPAYQRESLKGETEYLAKHYFCFPLTGELYPCFVERGISLLRQGGILSAIFPNTWLRARHGSKLRLFLSQSGIQEIIDLAYQETGSPTIPRTCIVTVVKGEPSPSLSVVRGIFPDTEHFSHFLEKNRYSVPRCRIGEEIWILADTSAQDLIGKIQNAGTSLAEYVMGALYHGIRIGINSPRLIDGVTMKRLIAEDPGSAAIFRPFVTPGGLKRYLPPSPQCYLIITAQESADAEYPAVFRHLRNHSGVAIRKKSGTGTYKRTMPDANSQSGFPCKDRYSDLFARPKIMFPGIARERRFTLDCGGHYCPHTCGLILSSSLYLLGILNSRLMWFFISQTLPPFRGDYRRLYGPLFENIPVYVPDFEDREDAIRHDSVEVMVRQMLALHQMVNETEDPVKKAVYWQQIRDRDHKIDLLVYDLYRLTPYEIRIVETATSGTEQPF